MIKKIIGKAGLSYALYAPNHRGKFRMLRLLDVVLGPFKLFSKRSKLNLTVYLSSPMDVSYYRSGSPKPQNCANLDQEMYSIVDELEPGDVFVDIGANVGVYSLLASKKVGAAGLVIAIEPSCREYARLLANIAANQTINILPLHLALGSTNGIVGFEVDSIHTGLNHLSAGAAAKSGKVKVPLMNGTDLIAMLKPSSTIAVLKIDVEGAEFEVLKGLEGYLGKNLVRKVVVEITPRFLAAFGTSKEELYTLMKNLGYRPTIDAADAQYDEVFVPQ